MAKTRVNLRVRSDLWAAAQRAIPEHGKDATAVVEHALERLLGVRSGENGRRLSPRLREGVKPRPKGAKR